MFSDYTVDIILTSDLRSSLLKRKHTRDIEHSLTTFALAVHLEDDGRSYLLLPFRSNPGDIAHECWHVAKRMSDYLGIELDNETIAYCLGHLVNQVHKHIKGSK